MPDGSSYKLLRRFCDVRPTEIRITLCLFSYFFLIALSFYITKPVKENFLIGVTPGWWPYAELITAGLIGCVVAFDAKLLKRLPRRNYFFGLSVFFALCLPVFGVLFDIQVQGSALGVDAPVPLLNAVRKSWPVPVIVFSLWSDIFIAMSVTHFWVTVNDTLRLFQAKRLIGFFVTGGLLGGIAGSLLTSVLAPSIGPSNLLLVCPAVLVLTLPIIQSIYSERSGYRLSQEYTRSGSRHRTSYWQGIRAVGESRYVRILAGVLASGMVAGSLINYQFKIVIRKEIPGDIQRTAFLGSFFLAILILSAVFHLTATGRILNKFGIRAGLLVAPSLLLVALLSVFVLPAAGLMAWACMIRGSDKTFDSTISQSVRELLYIPIPGHIKYEAKIFIDMFINKFSVGLGAVLFLVLYRVSSFPLKSTATQIRELGMMVILFTAIWIVLVGIIYQEYLNAVKKDLTRKWEDAETIVARHVDLDATRLILDTLQSRDKSPTLYAMNLFQLFQKQKLSPELIRALSHKEDELKARSMDSLVDVGGEVLYRGIEEEMAESDVGSMVQEVMELDSYESIMSRRFIDFARNRTASEVERMEMARLISLMPSTPEVIRCLECLLQDESPDVLHYALSGATVHLRRELMPLIIPLLGNAATRQMAEDTLAAYGPGIEAMLKRHLQNRQEHLKVRSSIPKVLASFGDQKSADILIAELAQGEAEMEQELVEALYRIHSNNPGIHFRKKKVLPSVLSLIRKSYEGFLHSPGGSQAAAEPLQHSISDIRIKRIFDLLALIYPSEDIVKAYQNLLQGTRTSVDYSLELLDNIIDWDIKVFLFPILQDLPPDEREERLRKLAESLDKQIVWKEPESAV